jgi:Transposase DDE domain
MLEQLEEANLLPEAMLGDTLYTNDENVQAAAGFGVEMVGPVPGRAPESDAEALTIDDFAIDERTGMVDACPAGHEPLSCTRDEQTGKTKVEMPARACVGCPFRQQCPIENSDDGRYTLDYSDRQQRLAARRREQETDAFKKRYAMRSGIESTNSGLKNRLGLGKLPVRGRGSVFRVVWHKLAGWNVLRAAASTKLRARVAERMRSTMKQSESATFGQCFGVLLGSGKHRDHIFQLAWQPSRRLRRLPAA